MELNFDIRGNLKPYNIIEVSLDTFKQTFVTAFDEDSTRQQLFANYEKYMNGLVNHLSKEFYQWIDGSYISTKEKPKDIDFVTILDYKDYEANKVLLEKEFASFPVRKKYKVDAYLVANYPENHKKHIFTQSDLLYWRNLFGKTRVNRAKKQFEKGIIQINYKLDEQ